jgi:hypothetical protein
VWLLRIAVLLTPLAVFAWLAPPAARESLSRTAEYFIGWQVLIRASRYGRLGLFAPMVRIWWYLIWIAMIGLTEYYARRTRQSEMVTLGGMLVVPLVTPIVLALVPLDPYLEEPGRLPAAPSGLGSAKGRRGAFGLRFPLLAEYLEGQPEATWAGMQARYKPVKANFEFLLPAHPASTERLLAEAQKIGFATWTGNLGSAPLVYGAGRIQPAHLEQTIGWLADAGMPGQKLRVAYRDGAGTPFRREVHMERTAASRLNFEFLLEADPAAMERLLAEARTSGLVTWTRTEGQVPVVYGAGVVQPSAVEQAVRWLASAGIPGRRLKVSYRDPAGTEHSRELVIGA